MSSDCECHSQSISLTCRFVSPADNNSIDTSTDRQGQKVRSLLSTKSVRLPHLLYSLDYKACLKKLTSGAKADPSRVRITDLSEASLDPLARKVRYQLRVKHGIRSGIPMVLSSEKPRCSLLPVSELTHDPFELQVRIQLCRLFTSCQLPSLSRALRWICPVDKFLLNLLNEYCRAFRG